MNGRFVDVTVDLSSQTARSGELTPDNGASPVKLAAKPNLTKGWKLWDVAQLRSGRSKRQFVLVMESDWLSLLVIQEKLQKAGLKVCGASTTDDALREIRRRMPVGVIFESSPRAGEVVKQLRSDTRFGNKPIYELSLHPAFSRCSSPDVTRVFSKLTQPLNDVIDRFLADLPATEFAEVRKPLPISEAEATALQNFDAILRENINEVCRAWQGVEISVQDNTRRNYWQLFQPRVRSLLSAAALAGRDSLVAQVREIARPLNALGENEWPLPQNTVETIFREIKKLHAMTSAPIQVCSEQPKPALHEAPPLAEPSMNPENLSADSEQLEVSETPPEEASIQAQADSPSISSDPIVHLQVSSPPPSLEQAVSYTNPLNMVPSSALAIADCPPEGDRRLRESITALARVTASLEKERAERRRADERAASLAAQLQTLHRQLGQDLETEKGLQKRIADLEQRLQRADESLVQAQADLERENQTRSLAEQELAAVADLNSRWNENERLLEEAKAAFRRNQQGAETRLQANIASLQSTEEKLQKERAERQRLEETVSLLERKGREQSEQSQGEISKLEGARDFAELERRRLAEEMLHLRYLAMDSRRGSQASLNNFRSQLRPALHDLQESIFRLLQGGLNEAQNQLAQTALENVLLVQNAAQESDPGSSNASRESTVAPSRNGAPDSRKSSRTASGVLI